MRVVLVFIDGTICDRTCQLRLQGTDEFYKREAIMAARPVPGSAACLQELSHHYQVIYIGARPPRALAYTKEWLASNEFPEGPILLGPTHEQRLEIVRQLRTEFDFAAGIGDRWDDNELHLELGCLSIILKEHEGNWHTVRKYLLGESIG
jgi:uncharacterized HAD superfamily protein